MSGARALRELARRTDVPLPSAAHRARRTEELDWVAAHGWADALLEARADVEMARRAGVRVGPGRGSTQASLLLWCMGLVELDPVIHRLPASMFYDEHASDPALRASWSVSDPMPASDRFRYHPLVAALDCALRTQSHTRLASDGPSVEVACRRLARDWCSVDPEYLKSPWTVADGPWSFQRYPDEKWILSRCSSPGFEDLVDAVALGRPGPAGCGMLEAYLSDRTDERASSGTAERPLFIYREQVHDIGRRVLGLGIDATRRFARDVLCRGPWSARLVKALPDRSREHAAALWLQMTDWAPYLFPKSHALGRAGLLVGCVRHGAGGVLK